MRRFYRKDVPGILEMFDDDAIIYEPFSKQGLLKGKREIAPFLRFVTEGNSSLDYYISSVAPDNNNTASGDSAQLKVLADVIFLKGSKTNFRFTFDLEAPDDALEIPKIMALRIEPAS
jgi:hypothetical protein